MSRSYKHTPITKDGNRCKKPFKKIANRKVRRMLNNPNFDIRKKSADHRQLTESWEIADYVCYWSKERVTEHYHDAYAHYEWFREKYPTLELYLKDWNKYIKRK